MKKFIILSLCGLLIMAFSATVYAQKLDFKVSGAIYTTSYLYRNLPDTEDIFGGPKSPSDWTSSTASKRGTIDRTQSWMATRARLKFDAVMEKDLSGTIYFEMDSSRWGDNEGSSKDGSLQRNSMGYWGADRAAVEVKQAFIDFGLSKIGLPVPVSMRIGLVPAAVRPHMVLDIDGMGIIGTIKLDPVTITPMWFKPFEGKDAAADDVDYYALEVSAKIDKLTVGGYGLYANMNSYSIDSASTAASAAYEAGTDNQAKMFWLGAYLDGRLGPVDINTDIVMDRGKVESIKYPVTKADVKYSGWATRARVDYPWEKFNFGAAFSYGSGANAKKTSETGLPGETVAAGTAASTKMGSYVHPPGDFGSNPDRLSIFWGSPVTTVDPKFSSTDSNTSMYRGSFGGTWMAKIYGSYKLAPWYKVTLGGMYIGDTTKNGNTVGTARKSPYAATDLRDDKTIGVEVGLLNDFLIYNNLTLGVNLGYLFPGNALDQWDAMATGTDKNVDMKNPWILGTYLNYKF